MSNHPNNFGPGTAQHERLLDMLLARATEGLSEPEQVELERLLATNPDFDADQFELAAAAAAVAMVEPSMHQQGLPSATRNKLLALADRHTTAAAASPMGSSTQLRISEASKTQAARPQIVVPPRRLSLGWLAAAAAIGFAAVGWWQVVNRPGQPMVTLETYAKQFEDFKASADDAIHWPWAGKEKGFEAVKGEVYWSDKLQRGYMLLSGLAPNDPRVKQYQLWIVDPKRDKNPVDGGVFDIAAATGPEQRTAAGEIIVPIDCKLRVENPAAFALTVEQPGGVVVSAGPLVVVAAK